LKKALLVAWTIIAIAVCVARAEDDLKNPGNNVLLHASPKQRAAMLANVVRAGADGEPCIGELAFYRGNTDAMPAPQKKSLMKGNENSAIWDVRCTNGKAYEVLIRPDDSYIVMDCATWVLLGEQHCFRKP
jgi:hypothetical protein